MKNLYKIIFLLVVNLLPYAVLSQLETFSLGDQVTRNFKISLNDNEKKFGDTIYFEKPDTSMNLTITSLTNLTIIFENIPFANITGAPIFQINDVSIDEIESFKSHVFTIKVKPGSNHGIGYLYFEKGNAENKSTYDGIVLNFDGKNRYTNIPVPPVIPPVVIPKVAGCHQLAQNPINGSVFNNCSGAPIRVVSQILGGNNYFSLIHDTLFIPAKSPKDYLYTYSHALGFRDSIEIMYTATGDSIDTKHGTLKIYGKPKLEGGYCASRNSIILSTISDSTKKVLLLTPGNIKPNINLLKGRDVSSLQDSSLLSGSTYYFKMGASENYLITRLGNLNLQTNSNYSITVIHYTGNTFLLDTSFNITVSTATNYPIQAPIQGITKAKAVKIYNTCALMNFTSGNGNAASFWFQEGDYPALPVSGELKAGGYLQDHTVNQNITVTLKQLKPSTTYYVTIVEYNYTTKLCEEYYNYNTTIVGSFSFKTAFKEDFGIKSPVDLTVSNTQPSISGKYNNIIIAEGGHATLSGDVIGLGTLTVQKGGVLDLNGYSIGASGKIIIQDGGIVLETTTTATTGFKKFVQVNRSASTNAYRYLATPVNGGTLSSALMSYSYNENETKRKKGDYQTGWDTLNSPMQPGIGYASFSPGNISNSDFEGVINNGTISVNATHTPIEADDALDGWNLLGNPYPSPISVSGFLSANSSVVNASGVYFWNGSNYTTKNTANIPVAQGFFVHAKTNGPILFENTMRNSGINELYRLSETVQKIHLNLYSNLNQDHLQIELRDNASDNFEPSLDALKLRVSTANEFYGITATDKKPVSINILMDDGKDKKIPLGLHVAQAGTFKLSLGENTFAVYSKIMLKDLVTGTLVDLIDAPYSFTASQSSDVRLELVLSSNNISTGLLSPTINQILINTAPGVILINSNGKDVQIRITDMMGKVHYTGMHDGNSVSIPVEGNNLYIVQTQTAETINMQRVIVY